MYITWILAVFIVYGYIYHMYLKVISNELYSVILILMCLKDKNSQVKITETSPVINSLDFIKVK